MPAIEARQRSSSPAVLVVPLLAIMLAFYLWPLLRTIVNSFHPFTPAGIDTATWTLANYGRLLEPDYLDALVRSLRVGAIITLVTAVLAYPVASFVVARSARAQAVLLLVYMAPWLVNVVVKAFGWSLILSSNGIINRSLKALGLIGPPLQLMFNELGIIIGLVHGHFMFVLLPLWAALSALDRNVYWAAANLGAGPWQIFLRVTLPLTLPALLAGALINFTMNIAAFATPALLGGSRARVLSFVAYEVNLIDLDWPLGGALAVALLALTLAPIWLAQKIAGRRAGRGSGA